MRRTTAACTAVAALAALAAAPHAEAASHHPRPPAAAVAHWSFDEPAGTVARDSVSRRADPISYVFSDARYMDDSDPVRRPGVLGRALWMDGWSTEISAPGSGLRNPEEGFTIEAWIAPHAYEHGIDGKPQAVVSQLSQDSHRGFVVGLRRFGQLSFSLGFGDRLVEVTGDSEAPAAKDRWSHVAATWDPQDRELRLYRDGELVGTAEAPDSTEPQLAPEVPLLIGRHSNSTLLNGTFQANMYNGLLDELTISAQPLSNRTAERDHRSTVQRLPGRRVPMPDMTVDRARYDGDRHRPQYHMLPAEHWMNEPHAPVWYEGKYHIFYQHNPTGPYWGQIHWGHATSTDLVHWEEQEPALAPSADSIGPDGMWSGSAVVDGDRPLLFFTGGDDRLPFRQRTGMAEAVRDGDPDLPEWRTHPEVVTEAPDGLPAGPGTAWAQNFRDPFVWQEDGTWYQLVGSGIVDYDGAPRDGRIARKHGGAALLYKASAPEGPWEYQGPLFENDLATVPELGEVWELPVFLPLPGPDGEPSGKYILLAMPWWESFNEEAVQHTYYWIGEFDREQGRFVPDHERPREFDMGRDFTGPSGFTTPDGRTVVFSITQDRRSEQQHAQAGWAHNAGMPVSLSLREDGQLGVEPIAEVAELRERRLLRVRDASIERADTALARVRGDLLEIRAVIDPRGAERIDLALRATRDGAEQTVLSYDVADRRISVDRSRSSLDPDTRKNPHGGVVELADGKLELTVLLDRSMVETYVNGTRSLTTRVYPTRADATGLGLSAQGGSPRVESLDVWEMGGAYSEHVVPAEFDAPRQAGSGLANHDFATGDLTGWTVVSGDTFSDAQVTERTDWGWGGWFYQAETADDPAGHHLWGFNPDAGGDGATGELRSDTVELGGDGRVDLLISGGNDPDRLYAAVVRASDGEVLARATGRNGEQYRRVAFDLSEHVGEAVYVKVVDESTGGWGHINIDDVNLPVGSG